MTDSYIEQRDGGHYLTGTRVSLDSIVYAFRDGDSPETMQQNFSSLKLAQIYGAIAYYLENQAAIDAHLEQTAREFEASGVPLAEANPALWKRIQEARAQAAAPGQRRS